MKLAPKAFLNRVWEALPLGSEVISLDWVYEDEDYNIAVLVDDKEDSRVIEDRILDPIIDYDGVHGTYTLYMVWPKRKKMLAGVRQIARHTATTPIP